MSVRRLLCAPAMEPPASASCGAVLVGLVGLSVASALAGCEPEVLCENLCTRTLACEVTFAPSDDVDGNRILLGERSELQSCVRGCEESPAVTAESGRCVDAVTDKDSDPVTCQVPVAACFNIEL